MSAAIAGMPRILEETTSWAIVFKPHGVPSAPLTEGEWGTLLSWFLAERPEADAVVGKKAIERGLIHRLDTETEGVVLIAKTQAAFDGLAREQGAGRISKRYAAFCFRASDTVWGLPPVSALSEAGRLDRESLAEGLTVDIVSRFRPYGPGRKMVLPLFPDMRGYGDAGHTYTTTVEKIDSVPELNALRVVASLTRGFRHQVRAHLAIAGFPLVGDALYCPRIDANHGDGIPLQLHAIAISFPDPLDGSRVSFSLPLPDRMSR